MLQTSGTLYTLIILIFACIVVGYRRKRNLRLPPGPTGNWIFGPKLPLEDPFTAFEKWSRAFGPVYSIRQGLNDVIIVIGGYKEAMEIMEKEGNHLADRPRNVAAGEIFSGGMRTLLLKQGSRLTKYRKSFHAALQPRVAINYGTIQQTNAQNMILNILADPSEHQAHATRYATETIISIAYGLSSLECHAQQGEDRQIRQLDVIIERIRADQSKLVAVLRPGVYVFLEALPKIARRLPGWIYPYVKPLQQLHREELALFDEMVEGVRKSQECDSSGKRSGQYKEGYADVEESFTARILEQQAQLGITDDELAYLAGSMFGAGSETTASAISFVIMAAACFPDAQRKIQAEIDTVIDKDRPPTYRDENILPLVTAFYLEAYRWRPVSAGGFAHKATKDIHWNGYVIPKGASVYGHHWTIGRSSDIFPNPETFDPERWVVDKVDEKTGNVSKVITDSIKLWNFGFGRRVCPGSHVANRSLFVTTALLLWAFDIQQEPGHPIDTMAFTPHANVRPLPFKAKFTPRIPPEELRRMLAGDI